MEEFVGAATSVDDDNKLRMCFDMVDVDHSGTISKKELLETLKDTDHAKSILSLSDKAFAMPKPGIT